MEAFRLGASMYVPATRCHLEKIGNGCILPDLRSLVFCTEDAIQESEVPLALQHLAETLPLLEGIPGQPVPGRPGHRIPYRFIRPRNLDVLRSLLKMDLKGISGFVLPKFSLNNMKQWFTLLQPYPYLLMPTLETEAVFDPIAMLQLCRRLKNSPMRKKIVCLRIGGLDLLNILGIRRAQDRTIYDTPVGYCIRQLVALFRPAGFHLSAPAFEGLAHPEILRQEIALDLLNGLTGKAAVHPDQIPLIHNAYKVTAEDFVAAEALLDPSRPAVFRLGDRMCEKATHSLWAKGILFRAELYGKQD